MFQSMFSDFRMKSVKALTTLPIQCLECHSLITLSNHHFFVAHRDSPGSFSFSLVNVCVNLTKMMHFPHYIMSKKMMIAFLGT